MPPAALPRGFAFDGCFRLSLFGTMCTEDSPSGLWRTLGKRVGCKPSGVRIPHPPPPDPGTRWSPGVFPCGHKENPAPPKRRRCGSARPGAACPPVGGVHGHSPAHRETQSWCPPVGGVHGNGCGSARPGAASCGPPPWGGARSTDSARFPIRRSPGVERALRGRVHWTAVLRVTVSSEPPQGRNAARIRVRCRVRGGSSYSRTGAAPPRERLSEWRGFQRLRRRAPLALASPPARSRLRRAQAPRPSTTSAAGSAASSSPGTKSFEERRPDPMQLHPLAQRESMRRRH